MITEYDIYDDYKNEMGTNLSFDRWFEIISLILNKIIYKFIYKNGVWVFPGRIGFINVVKVYSRGNFGPMVKHIAKMVPKVVTLVKVNLNNHTFGYMFKTKWDKRRTYTSFRHKEYYVFKWYPVVKRKISANIIETHEKRDVKAFDAPLTKI